MVNRNPNKPKGFALIITISLLVLLLVIALGLLSLSSIAMRSAASGDHAAKARANARLSLMLAIGELQKELGPDQRVTARAEILDNDTETAAADGIAHPQWMGAWNSWDDWLNSPAVAATYTKGRSTRFRRWLVSHPDPLSLENIDLPASSGTAEMVTLVSARTKAGATAPIGKVEVPSVRVSGGRYGWWITGENQKALITAESSQNDVHGKLHARSGWPNAGVGWLTGLESAPDSKSAVDRSASLPSYGLADASAGFPEQVNARFHDLTVDSMGLAGNVRHGGLKKDLNLLLELPALPNEFGTFSRSQPGGTIIPIRSHTGYLPTPIYAQNLNFTSWYKLHQYYQLYRGGGDEAAADSQPVPFNGAGIWGSSTTPNINFNWHTGNLDHYGVGRTPIVSRLMLVFSTRRVPSTRTPGTFDYKLGVNPVVVIWNPYNVTLHSPRLAIQITPGALQYKAYVDGAVKVNWARLRRSGNKPLELNVYPMAGPNQTTTPIVLKPGETRIYSAVSGFVNAQDFLHSELYPGYQAPDAGGGFEVDLNGLTGLPGTSDVELAMRLSDTRTDHGGQYQMYWTVTNAQNVNQRYNELAANPVMDGAPIYLAEDSAGKRVRFSNSAQRIPFANFQFTLKSGEDLRNPGAGYENDDFRSKSFIHANPANQRAMYGEASKRMRGMAQYHVQIDTGAGNSVSPDFEPVSNRSFIGSAVSLGGALWPGQTRVVTNEFPLVPVTSIASLMHFKLIPGDARNFGTGRHLWEVSANQALGIGNSFGHPLIAGNAIYQDVADAACRGNPLQMKLIRDFHDHSYLNNDALWDDWFCSGITREDNGIIQSGRSMGQVVGDFAAGTSPLQNRSLMPWLESVDPSKTLAGILTDGSKPTADGWKTVARHVMVQGAFNINSTSVEAWKAVLAGLRDKELTYIDPDSGNIKTATMPADRVILSRFSLPAADKEGADAGDANSWLGIRTLTPKQIDRLARECVRQVKERGPFLNLSDFVNRRLANDETGACGALQAAIDWDEFLGRSPQPADEESINGRFKGGGDYITAPPADWNLPFANAAKGSRFTGIPGYVTQADILKRIGNMITSRDDTFRIRAYGESSDADGTVRASAWCEAVVQRAPEYLDTIDAPETRFDGLGSPINKSFGRRFRIVSFRWLSKNEI